MFYIPIVNIPALYFEIAPKNNQTVEFLETLQINTNYVNDILYKKTFAIVTFYHQKKKIQIGLLKYLKIRLSLPGSFF